MTRFDECLQYALERADWLIEQIHLGQIQASAFESAIQSYLQKQGYGKAVRQRLLDLCMTHFDGQQR